MKRMFTVAAAIVVLAALCTAANAQNQWGIPLNPGERLVSVDGVAVNGSQYYPQYSTVVSQPVTNNVQKVVTRKPEATTAKPAEKASTTGAVASKTTSTSLSMYSGDDQARAQAEANYMAAHGIRGHVGGLIGRFEGVGWATGGMPNTCTPGYAMTLTADAIAHGPGGVYRVRAWR